LSLPASVRGWLEPALDPDEEWTWADVERRLTDNTAQLWLGSGCAMLTELFPANIHVWLGGGSLKGLLELRPHVERTARFWGCERATIAGRLGWDRVLRPFGYVRTGDELEKRL
jgi:hypothetical protein